MPHLRRWQAIGTSLLVLTGVVATSPANPSGAEDAPTCAFRYVAAGDAVADGIEVDTKDQPSEEKRYSRQLLNEHIRTTGFPGCEYNTAHDPTTTDTFVTENVYEGISQQAAIWKQDVRLVTITLGRQNSTIVDHVEKCFKNVKDHDFLDANTCALNVLANPTHWDKLKKDLDSILNTIKVQMDGAPSDIVVAVTGYFNPYPAATDVATKIPGFCAKLQDTIATCIARWVLLPPALVTLDQVVQKLNTTIKEVVDKFHTGSQGRYFFVNPYEKFKSHCMKMKVKIETTVYHPTNTVHDHNTDDTNFGCETNWVATDHDDGTKSPFLYLTPAATGVLILATQKTLEMGIYPNEDGHDCIADLIWEATKKRLGSQEEPKDACQ
jgi:hypothetical protein